MSDAEIIGRILRIYSPGSEMEMRGLVNTWRRDYMPGVEYPEAPRYPPGFIALCRARQQESRESPPILSMLRFLA